MQPDGNVQMSIEKTLKDMDVKIESLHIKGHQDSRKKFTLPQLVNKATEVGLTWQARPNIIADKLANIAKQQLRKDQKCEFTILPHAKAYLFIKGKPITRKIQTALPKAETKEDLKYS
eukprot:9277824-Ditylum_brightwellii.AAC.1